MAVENEINDRIITLTIAGETKNTNFLRQEISHNV